MIAEELDRIEEDYDLGYGISGGDWRGDWKRLIAALRESMAQLKEAREIIANLLDLDVEDVSPTAVWDRAEAFLKETT